MSEILNEQLSALLDGELPPAETELLLRRLARNPERRACLARYVAMGAALRGGAAPLMGDFAAQVSARLAAEPALAPRATPPRAMWWRPVSGLAVAAAVAGVAIALLPRESGQPRGVAPAARAQLPAAAPAVATVAAEAPVPAARIRATVPGAEPASYVTPNANPRDLNVIPRAELARYVVAHSAVAMPLTGRSMLTSLIAESPAEDIPVAAGARR